MRKLANITTGKIRTEIYVDGRELTQMEQMTHDAAARVMNAFLDACETFISTDMDNRVRDICLANLTSNVASSVIMAGAQLLCSATPQEMRAEAGRSLADSLALMALRNIREDRDWIFPAQEK